MRPPIDLAKSRSVHAGCGCPKKKSEQLLRNYIVCPSRGRSGLTSQAEPRGRRESFWTRAADVRTAVGLGGKARLGRYRRGRRRSQVRAHLHRIVGNLLCTSLTLALELLVGAHRPMRRPLVAALVVCAISAAAALTVAPAARPMRTRRMPQCARMSFAAPGPFEVRAMLPGKRISSPAPLARYLRLTATPAVHRTMLPTT